MALLEQETVVPLHSEPEPTPTTEMGLQVNPTKALTSCRTTPRSPRIALPDAELACQANRFIQLGNAASD